MLKRINVPIYSPDGIEESVRLRFYPVHQCPLCYTSFNGAAMSSSVLPPSHLHPKYKKNRLYISHYCEVCGRGFLGVYNEYEDPDDRRPVFLLDFCTPESKSQKHWPNEIHDHFTEFIAIYNQSLQAELNGQDKICGMGYRKSLEHLIKEFLIKFVGCNREEILNMNLGRCINEKIDNPKLHTVASRCTWLGNDHSHYQPLFEEYDLDDLKALIDAVAYWISIEIITIRAAEMQSRRRTPAQR